MKQLYLKKYDIMFPSKASWSGGASEGYSIYFKCLEKIFELNPSFKKSSKELEFIEPYIKNKNFKYGGSFL